MIKKKAPNLRIQGASFESMEFQIARGLEFLETLGPGASLPSLPGRLPGLVAERVANMVSLLDRVDSLDLLGNMKQVDLANIMASPGESWRDVGESHAVTEVVALVLLGLGLPRVKGEGARNAAEVVEALRADAQWIVEASQMSATVEAETTDDSMTKVALRSRMDRISVRNSHYTNIGRQLNTSFFSRPKVREIMEARVGFTGDDVDAVTKTLGEVQQKRIWEAFEKVRELMGRVNPPPDQARAALERLFTTPADLFAITPTSLAAEAGLDEIRVRAALDTFVVAPLQATPVDLVQAFTRGDNPFASSGLLKVDEDVYFPLTTALLSEHVRSRVEDAFKQGRHWATFDEQRKKWSESRAKGLLAALLGGARPRLENFNYLIPDTGADVHLLAADAAPAAKGVHQVEGDILFVVDNVAFCVEVKAGALNERARAGDTRAVMRGLTGIITKADEQAERLRSLILANQGIWTARREWVDLPGVQEVHNIVVVLDDLGPVILSTGALVDAKLIVSERVPWIVSMHDLTVFRDVIEHPAQFLTFLRRRTQAEAARWLDAVDELDVMMFFLNGGLYFESDPDQGENGERPRHVDVAKRRRHRQQGPVFVGTLTDPLDAWYEPRTKSSKPSRDEGPFVLRFLEWSRERQVPGWLRVGADLVGLGSSTRSRFITEHARVVDRARYGSQASMTIGGDDGEGRWLFLLGGDSPGHRIDIGPYLRLKKYQHRAARVTAWVVDANGEPSRYAHLEGAWKADPAVEAEVHEAERQGKLVVVDRTPASVPPSAKRATRRLRGTRRSRK